jgi:YD repeat-containing protein
MRRESAEREPDGLATWNLAWSKACPYCGAHPDTRCVKEGVRLPERFVHNQRWDQAERLVRARVALMARRRI